MYTMHSLDSLGNTGKKATYTCMWFNKKAAAFKTFHQSC